MMYDGSGGEFVELTNVGNAPVDMTGFVTTTSRLPGVRPERVRRGAAWRVGRVRGGRAERLSLRLSLCPGVKVIGPYTNLGRADEINIYDANDELVDRLTYGDNIIGGFARRRRAAVWP